MSLVPAVKEKEILVRKFIDWDKCRNMFYNNIYLDNWKVVIKIPLIPNENSEGDIKIRKFDLEKYTYLCGY